MQDVEEQVTRSTYIKMLRGKSMERNLSAKVRTDFNELRSSSKMSTRDAGAVRWMSCFAPSAASKFLAAMMTCAPRSAKTLAVSVPIPLAPPGLVREVVQRMDGPVTMTVRLEASMPAVTCSAVEADPNPLGPGSPVTSLKSPILPAPPKEGGSYAARRR
ncbi:hypothetical protein B296_00046556 [Ensete ventricosum]|uniref:Uncharacterized protein n=1 Tax=Ensete ventricosum TaxID=4639 RepID=A0A426YEA3_ENSVE|nr:hypothetical protein B296_00046556 [Ensete ventricosum]